MAYGCMDAVIASMTSIMNSILGVVGRILRSMGEGDNGEGISSLLVLMLWS